MMEIQFHFVSLLFVLSKDRNESNLIRYRVKVQVQVQVLPVRQQQQQHPAAGGWSSARASLRS
jgi:hypothetical protein